MSGLTEVGINHPANKRPRWNTQNDIGSKPIPVQADQTNGILNVGLKRRKITMDDILTQSLQPHPRDIPRPQTAPPEQITTTITPQSHRMITRSTSAKDRLGSIASPIIRSQTASPSQSLENDLSISRAAKEALGKVNTSLQNSVEGLKDDLDREKKYVEEFRKSGWEQLSQLKKEHELVLQRSKDTDNELKVCKDSLMVVKNSEKDISDQLIRERREWEKEKTSLVREDQSKIQLRQKLDRVEKELLEVQGENLLLKEEKDRMIRESNQKDRRYKELFEEKTEISNKLVAINDENINIQARFDEHIEISKEVEHSLKRLKEEKSNWDNQVKQLKKNNKKLKKNNKQLKNDNNQFTKGNQKLKEELQALNLTVKTQNESLKQNAEKNGELQIDKDLLARTIKDLQTSLTLSEVNNESLKNNIKIQEQKLDNMDKFAERIKVAYSKYLIKFGAKMIMTVSVLEHRLGKSGIF